MEDRSIATVWIVNPPLNQLSRQTRVKLRVDLERAIADEAVKVIVLLGHGRTFSVGADIKELAQQWPTGGERAAMEEYVRAYQSHNLAPLVAMIDGSPKPIVALIHGEAFGGGLELALACQYRVCTPTAQLRLPEVLIGIIPGALGTQLLPRLASFDTCLRICVGCTPCTAQDALAASIVDQVIPAVPGDSNTAASYHRRLLTVLRNQLARGRDAPHPFRRTSRLPVPVALGEATRMAHTYASAQPHALPPPHKGGLAAHGALEALLACVKAGAAFERGALAESEISKTLVVSLQAQALRYAFLAEREATRVVFARGGGRRDRGTVAHTASSPEEETHEQEVPEVRHVGVVGSGVMGSGIAAAFLMAGYPVVLVDTAPVALKKASAGIAAIVAGAVRRKKVASAAAGAALLQALTTSTSFEALARCDLVVEAVFEDLQVKQGVFARLDAVCKPSCLLASNTSSLDIDAAAAGAGPARGERVLGLHFFTPAHVMRLVEVVVCKVTSAATLEAAAAVVKRLGKVGVLVANMPGFVANRCVFPYVMESMLLLEDFHYTSAPSFAHAATVADVDAAIRDFGLSMGPFQMADLSGLDVGYRIRKEKHLVTEGGGGADADGEQQPPSPFKTRPTGALHGPGRRYSRIGDELYRAGRLGVKSGKGFYDYTQRSGGGGGGGGRMPAGVLDPSVAQVIERERARKETVLFGGRVACAAVTKDGECPPRESMDAIQQRLLYPLINEAFRLLGEGGVPSDRPGDVDVIFLRGYGWPAWTGGPLFHADRAITLPVLLQRLQAFARMFPASLYFQPAPLLLEMVKKQVSVADLQRNPALVAALMDARGKAFL